MYFTFSSMFHRLMSGIIWAVSCEKGADDMTRDFE